MARTAPPWIRLYYLATPLFALADWAGANVRTAGLEGHPEWRIGYYALCTGAGLLLYLRPAWSAGVGLVEASANVGLLILGVLLPYFDAIDAAAQRQTFDRLPFGPGFLANFLISGGVWVAIFQRQLFRLQRGS